jgi:hypothetical protein
MQSSLMERLGPRARKGAISRVRSGLPASYILRADPTFVKTVSAAQILARRHVPLRNAMGIVERLLSGEEVFVELPLVESFETFERELLNLGVRAVRQGTAMPPDPRTTQQRPNHPNLTGVVDELAVANTTRAALEKARFFLAQAEAAEPAAHTVRRLPFLANIEAAVVFGRSVTLYLQKEFSNQSEFHGWYEQVRARLRANPRFQYLLETRNLILHEGPAPIRRTVQVTVHFAMSSDMTLDTVVIRGQPRYRRSAHILYADTLAKLLDPVRRWKRRRDAIRKQKAALREQATSAPSVADGFYFDEPGVAEVPVKEVVREYLDELEIVVAEAETRFCTSG